MIRRGGKCLDKHFPQATSSAIKQVSPTKQPKRKKTASKELQPTRTEDQQINEPLQIKNKTKKKNNNRLMSSCKSSCRENGKKLGGGGGGRADEQLQKLLQRKRQETRGEGGGGLIPNKHLPNSILHPSKLLQNLLVWRPHPTLRKTLLNIKNARSNHTVVSV